MYSCPPQPFSLWCVGSELLQLNFEQPYLLWFFFFLCIHFQFIPDHLAQWAQQICQFLLNINLQLFAFLLESFGTSTYNSEPDPAFHGLQKWWLASFEVSQSLQHKLEKEHASGDWDIPANCPHVNKLFLEKGISNTRFLLNHSFTQAVAV